MLTIRPMRRDDIPLGLELCRAARWNQLEADWRRLLAIEPGGLFVCEADGRPCATASTTSYGTQSGWIGMLLVHADFRRRGIGTAMIQRCIETLEAKRIESIKLDATDQGRPVYRKIGFRDERPIVRYAGAVPPGATPHRGVRPMAAADWPAVAALDRPAFGADRLRLLRRLAEDGRAVVARGAEGLRGFGFSRPGHDAAFLGPVVAADAEAALAVVETLLADLPEGQVFWDVLADHRAAVGMAESFGLAVDRRLTRMVLGEKMNPGEVGLVYGAAGFELG